MISNRVKRNIWLTLAILSVAGVVERAVRLTTPDGDWWNLFSAVIITAFCSKFYICYRQKVNKGQLFDK